MQVRRLGSRDLALAEDLVSNFLGPPRDAESLEAWLVDERNVAVAALVAGHCVGLAYGYRLARLDRRSDGLLLYSIDVLESARRRGIGKRLVEGMRKEAPGPMWLLTNESNEGAMALYRRSGGHRPNPDDVMWTFPAE